MSRNAVQLSTMIPICTTMSTVKRQFNKKRNEYTVRRKMDIVNGHNIYCT